MFGFCYRNKEANVGRSAIHHAAEKRSVHLKFKPPKKRTTAGRVKKTWDWVLSFLERVEKGFCLGGVIKRKQCEVSSEFGTEFSLWYIFRYKSSLCDLNQHSKMSQTLWASSFMESQNWLSSTQNSPSGFLKSQLNDEYAYSIPHLYTTLVP